MPHCNISLDNYTGQYTSGDLIQGKVTLNFVSKTKIRCVRVKLSAKEHTEFMGTGSRDGKNKDSLVHGDNDVFVSELTLFGSGSSGSSLPAGEHVYPFSFQLPANLPGSYKCQYGYIKYIIQATVDRPMAFDYVDEVVIEVASPVDLNHLGRLDLLWPRSLSEDKTLCCWLCAHGPISMSADLPKISLVPGETVQIVVKVTNRSKSKMECVQLKMKQKVSCYDGLQPGDKKEIRKNIIELNEPGLDPGGEKTYTFNVTLPMNFPVPNFTLCTLFKIDYVYKIVAKIRGMHSNLELEMRPEVGNIQFDPPPGDLVVPTIYNPRSSQEYTPRRSSQGYASINEGYLAPPMVHTPRSSQGSSLPNSYGYTPRSSEGYISSSPRNSHGYLPTDAHVRLGSSTLAPPMLILPRNSHGYLAPPMVHTPRTSQQSTPRNSDTVVTFTSAPPAYDTLDLN